MPPSRHSTNPEDAIPPGRLITTQQIFAYPVDTLPARNTLCHPVYSLPPSRHVPKPSTYSISSVRREPTVNTLKHDGRRTPPQNQSQLDNVDVSNRSKNSKPTTTTSRVSIVPRCVQKTRNSTYTYGEVLECSKCARTQNVSFFAAKQDRDKP